MVVAFHAATLATGRALPLTRTGLSPLGTRQLSWRTKGAPFAAAALEHDIHVSVSPGGTRDGRFLPNGIRWVVERLFAWLSRYRRLNIVYDRAPDLFAAHVWSAMISIISRRLVAHTQAQQEI